MRRHGTIPVDTYMSGGFKPKPLESNDLNRVEMMSTTSFPLGI